MPDQERLPTGPGPDVDQRRRKVLQIGLGLAGTALALDIMAATKPATSVLAAATTFWSGGHLPSTDSQTGETGGAENSAQRGPFHPTETQGQTAGSIDGALAQQGNAVAEIGELSPQAGLQWLEQHWQVVLEIGVPLGAAATIAKIIHGRSTADKVMESTFQHALTLLESPDIEPRAAAATELLYLVSNPRSEKYHQRIFAMAVEHFRKRDVEHADQRETVADFKFVPVLIFAAAAIRETLQRKGANVGAARGERLNASQIHLDGLSLREADLSYVMLQRATFNGAVLSFADFSHADLAGADLRRTTLNRANLSHAILSGTSLNGARAREANLSHAVLRNTDLEHADLSYAHLEEVELGDDARVRGANIYRATGMTGEMRKRLLDMGAIEQDSPLI